MFTLSVPMWNLETCLLLFVDLDGIRFNPSTQILKSVDVLYTIQSVDAETHSASHVTYCQQTSSAARPLLFVSSLALVSPPDMFE